MLTRDLAIVDYRSSRPWPDRLTRRRDAHWLAAATAATAIYQKGEGTRRSDLHAAVGSAMTDLLPRAGGDPEWRTVRRVRAFCKLLDEVSRYQKVDVAAVARERLLIFSLAAARRRRVGPEFPLEAGWLERRTGDSLESIRERLHRDLPANARLRLFDGYPSPEALLARYNVAQTQCCLYGARRLRIWLRRDLRAALTAVKLAGLMHEIWRHGPNGYRIDVSGPSAVLRRSGRYGARMARMLPLLLACEDWRLRADIATPNGTEVGFHLSPADGLSSAAATPRPFDSEVERRFATAFGATRDGWTLGRETTILHRGQRVFLPDFTFRHDDGTLAHLEIAGFWTPEYLQKKTATLTRFAAEPVLVAAPEKTAAAFDDLGPTVIRYKTRLRPEVVLDALEAARSEGAG